MGWYCHPDTLTMAQAEALTRRRTQAERGTVEYLKAYREAYAEAAGGSFTVSLERYLAELDAEIARGGQRPAHGNPQVRQSGVVSEGLPVPPADASRHYNPFQYAAAPEEMAALMVAMMPKDECAGQAACASEGFPDD